MTGNSFPVSKDFLLIDLATRKPLFVSDGGTAGPYLMIPYQQIDELRQRLDRHEIRYWVEENVMSYNRSPEIALVNFGRMGDARTIQAVLDSAQ